MSTVKLIVNSINYILTAAMLVAVWIPRRTGAVRFLVGGVLSVAIAVWLAESGKRLIVLPGHPAFPSGHMTFATAVVTCLALRDIRWLWAGIPICCVMGWGLVEAHYHSPVDILGATLLGPVATLTVMLIIRTAGRRPAK